MHRRKNKALVYGLLMLFMLSITGAAWAEPVDTNNNDKGNAEVQPASLFKDVTAGDSNLIYINYLAKRSIISGFPDGGFHPDEGLSRAEAATLLVKAAGLNGSENKASFKDVNAGHWAAGNIAAAAEAGYLKGYPDGTFHPEEKLSRVQGISLVLRLSKQKDPGTELPALKDIDSQHWAARSVAIGLAAGMVGLTADKTQFLPDENFSRGDLTRALAVLLTTDPDLSSVALNGSLGIKKGEVKLNDQAVTGTVSIKAGDLIVVATGGEAQLSYPDGSGFLIKENTNLAVKECKGKNYITKDGSPGTAVDWLLVDIKKGNVFGALASNPNVKEADQTEKKTAGLGGRLLAGLSDSLGILVASERELPWYQTASAKKVKVKVDMPWGVAAIRGSFWNNTVSDNGCSTSLLEGEVELSAGGQTQALEPGKSSAVSAANPVPTTPAPMTAAQVTAWVQQSTWLQNVAQNMQAQQAAVQTPVGITAPNQAPTVAPQVTAPSILNTLNQALTSVQQTAGFSEIKTLSSSTAPAPATAAAGSSGTTSSDELSSSRQAAWRLADVASTVYNNETVVLTRNLYITPPAGVPSGSYYEVHLNDGSSYYTVGRRVIGNPLLHLAKASEDISKLSVIFKDGNSNTMIYGLTGSGSSGTLTNLAMKTISGKIDIKQSSGSNCTPNVAPAAGINIRVRVSGQSAGGSFDSYQSVTMPAGSSTVNYSLTVPDNLSTNYNYTVHCDPQDPAFTNAYIGDSCNSPINVLAGNVSDANMVIQPGKYISGTISLPEANPSNSSIGGVIVAEGQSNSYYSRTDFSINPGASTFEYHLPLIPGNQYSLCYELNTLKKYTVEHQFYRKGYYSSSGGSVHTIGTSTGGVPSGATMVSVTDADISGLDLSMQTGYGYLIRGNIRLPGTDAAPEGGLRLGSLYADVQNGGTMYSTWRNNDGGATLVGIGSSYEGGVTRTSWQDFSGGMTSVEYVSNVPPSSNYIFVLNKFGTGFGDGNFAEPCSTYPALYRLDPVSVYVYSANVSQDLTLTSIGSSNSTTGLSPDIVAGPALLLGGTAYRLGSAEYTAKVAAAMADYKSWYFKSADGKWFNLRNANCTTYLTDSANEILASAAPLIGQVSGSQALTPEPTYCNAGSSVSVNAPSGSNLWASNDTVKAVFVNESRSIVIQGNPFTPSSIGNDTITVPLPSVLYSGNYVLTLYKELGGVQTLLGEARIYINNSNI